MRNETTHTPGPWKHFGNGHIYSPNLQLVAVVQHSRHAAADAALIEAAPGLRAEIERLRAENFALAAGQCANVVGDEGGTPVCTEVKRLTEALAELVACKDLKDYHDAMIRGDAEWIGSRRVRAIFDEYTQRKTAAWARANELLTLRRGG